MNAAGTTFVEDFESLTRLHPHETKVNAAHFEALRKALPKFEIEWDGGVMASLPGSAW